MIWFHLAVAIIFIIIGSPLGGVGVGLAGGAGCIVLVATGLHTKVAEDIPWTVIGIIMTVICAIAALQLAGGMDYLVHLAEVMLRKHPNQINYLAPLTTFLLSLLCGTGHTAYSVLPVIVEVAKEHKIRPSRPLSIAVVASQVAVASSPISAATLALVGVLEPLGVGYLEILAVTIPTTFIGCAVGAVVASRQGKDLIDDPIYQEREAKGLVSHNAAVADTGWRPKRTAIPSLVAFLVALVVVVGYATVSSEEVGVLTKPPMTSSAAIMLIMLTTAMIICMMSREDVKQLTTQTTFRAGMSAAICILGLAWLGNMFVNNYMDVLTHAGASILHSAPWFLSVILYLAAPLMFSHAATTVAFMPVVAKIGLSPMVMLACYPAVANYYLLPNYPTTVAAMEMDDTGSTRVGRIVLNHPFVLPGTVSIAVTVLLGAFWAPIVLG